VDASALAMGRPAGVERSSPSLRLTRLTFRSLRSSKSAVNPLAVRPSRSRRQQTTREPSPASTSFQSRANPGRSLVLPLNVSR
jgi:hypothetical protein